jgi:hypothetical protein
VKKYWTPGKQSALGSARVPGAGAAVAGHVAAERAAVLDRRRERSLTAAVKADRSAVVEDVGAGRDVDQPHSSQPEFGRERAHNQGDAADPAGVENAAEAGETVGQHYPVDAKLHIGVIVADVQQSAGRRILRDAGRLQQDSLDRGIVAAGQCVDRGLSNDTRNRADGGEEVALALSCAPGETGCAAALVLVAARHAPEWASAWAFPAPSAP